MLRFIKVPINIHVDFRLDLHFSNCLQRYIFAVLFYSIESVSISFILFNFYHIIREEVCFVHLLFSFD